MITVNGIWAPDNDRRGWLQDLPLDGHGFPKYQDDRQAVLVKHARQRRRFIDGGAHIGLYTVPMARRFDTVDAFEPVPANFECLTMNAGNPVFMPFSKVTLHNAALGAFNGNVKMTAKPKSSISWHVVERGPHIVVPVATLDSFGFDDVDAIKLDVEGHEYSALQGATETILRCRPVILIEEKHDEAREASGFLTELGMKAIWKSKNDYLFTWDGR